MRVILVQMWLRILVLNNLAYVKFLTKKKKTNYAIFCSRHIWKYILSRLPAVDRGLSAVCT